MNSKVNMVENLDEIIEQMKDIGDRLVPFCFPKNDSSLEAELNMLKVRDADVDGYPIVLHFSRADYGKHYLETMQIMSRNGTFLPFALVVKMAKKFLGSHKLYLVEIFKDGKKIYCWTVTLDRDGKPVDPVNQKYAQDCIFEGFKYKYMYPHQVNFY